MNISDLFKAIRNCIIGNIPSLRESHGAAQYVQHQHLRYDSRGTAHNLGRAERRADVKAAGGIRQYKRLKRAQAQP